MEQSDVLAQPAHPLDVARWVDQPTEHAGPGGLDLIAVEGGQARRLPLLYKPKRTRMSRVRMPVMTKVTTVPTMPAIWTSRRCWKGHCWIASARRWITSAACRSRACSPRAASDPDRIGS